jgi:hypothetical protein
MADVKTEHFAFFKECIDFTAVGVRCSGGFKHKITKAA